jgi:hypothetical protein
MRQKWKPKPRKKGLKDAQLNWWWKEIPDRRRIFVPPSTKKVKLTVTIDEDLYQELFQKAKKYEFSASQLVSAALRFCFKGDHRLWLPMGPHEARRLALRMTREGLSLNAIASILNRFRIYTTQGEQWSASAVHRLIHPRPVKEAASSKPPDLEDAPPDEAS